MVLSADLPKYESFFKVLTSLTKEFLTMLTSLREEFCAGADLPNSIVFFMALTSLREEFCDGAYLPKRGVL